MIRILTVILTLFSMSLLTLSTDPCDPTTDPSCFSGLPRQAGPCPEGWDPRIPCVPGLQPCREGEDPMATECIPVAQQPPLTPECKRWVMFLTNDLFIYKVSYKVT